MATGSDKHHHHDGHHHVEVHHYHIPHAKEFVAWVAVGFVGFTLLLVLLGTSVFFSPGLKPGDVADRDLFAPRTAQVIDADATQKAQQSAKEGLMPVFKKDESQDEPSLNLLHKTLTRIPAMQKGGYVSLGANLGLTPSETIYVLEADEPSYARMTQPSVGGQLSPEESVIRAKLTRKPQKLTRHAVENKNGSQEEKIIAVSTPGSELTQVSELLDKTTKRMLHSVPRYPGEDKATWEGIALELLPAGWSEDMRRSSAKIIASVLQPNMVIDRESSLARQNQAAEAVKPITREYKAGELIVKKGQKITEGESDVLQALGVSDLNKWPLILSMAMSLVAGIALVALFLYTYEPQHLFSTSSIGLMYTVAIVTCAVTLFVGNDYPQFVPLPAYALVLTIFFGQRAAIALTLPLVIMLAVDRVMDLQHLIALSTAAGAAIATYRGKRHSFMFVGFVIAVMQVMGNLAIMALTQDFPSVTQLGRGMLLEFLGGLSSAIVAIGSLPFLESIFGMLTPFRLAELTDADQPLLRKLEEAAPGTYQHSLAVANLAESGARAINADVNLVRAGAMYHDVGKMARPRYFIENQLGAANPHDFMAPEESRERVLAHVTDGIALAKEYSLPQAVQDFIPMHQGTSLMAYFYHKACVRDGVDNVDQSFYRYPGPKPQSKETAIVMLADVSEAVTHSMKDPTQEEVDVAINKVFQNRWDDNQFDESGLTHDELERVKKAFVRVWRTLHHERLKYPSTTTGKMAVPPDSIQSQPAPVQPAAQEENREPKDPPQIMSDDDCCSANAMQILATPDDPPEQNIPGATAEGAKERNL